MAAASPFPAYTPVEFHGAPSYLPVDWSAAPSAAPPAAAKRAKKAKKAPTEKPPPVAAPKSNKRAPMAAASPWAAPPMPSPLPSPLPAGDDFVAAKKAFDATVKRDDRNWAAMRRKAIARGEEVDDVPAPNLRFRLVEVDGALYMVDKATLKCYASDMNLDDDARALLDQHVGAYRPPMKGKGAEILPIFDD